MKYPVHILPGENKKIINSDISNLLLCRHFNLIEGLEITNKVSGYIETKYLALPREQLADLSTNLLGVFTIDDCKIRIIGDRKNYYNNYCLPNEQVDIPIYQTDFETDKNCLNWFVKIGDLIEQPVEYSNSPVNNFKASCKIIHTPTRWNYWHYSVTWLITLEGQEEAVLFSDLEEGQKKKLGRKLATESLSIFQKFSTIKIPDNPIIIEEKDYKEDL